MRKLLNEPDVVGLGAAAGRRAVRLRREVRRRLTGCQRRRPTHTIDLPNHSRSPTGDERVSQRPYRRPSNIHLTPLFTTVKHRNKNVGINCDVKKNPSRPPMGSGGDATGSERRLAQRWNTLFTTSQSVTYRCILSTAQSSLQNYSNLPGGVSLHEPLPQLGRAVPTSYIGFKMLLHNRKALMTSQ